MLTKEQKINRAIEMKKHFMPWAEIAKILGVSVGTLWNWTKDRKNEYKKSDVNLSSSYKKNLSDFLSIHVVIVLLTLFL